LFLATRKRYPFLADFGKITIWENGEIGQETGLADGFPVTIFVERKTKTYVFPNGCILSAGKKLLDTGCKCEVRMSYLNPRNLRAISNTSTESDTPLCPPHLSYHALQQTRLSTSNGANNGHELATRNRQTDIPELKYILFLYWLLARVDCFQFAASATTMRLAISMFLLALFVCGVGSGSIPREGSSFDFDGIIDRLVDDVGVLE
jgi:hypothetical protein